jgi:hypothetical protein
MKDSTTASRLDAAVTRLELVALRLESAASAITGVTADRAQAVASDVAEIEKIVRTMRLDPDA